MEVELEKILMAIPETRFPDLPTHMRVALILARLERLERLEDALTRTNHYRSNTRSKGESHAEWKIECVKAHIPKDIHPGYPVDFRVCAMAMELERLRKQKTPRERLLMEIANQFWTVDGKQMDVKYTPCPSCGQPVLVDELAQ